MVLNEGDIEAGFTTELNIGAGEEIKRWLLEAALWELRSIMLSNSLE